MSLFPCERDKRFRLAFLAGDGTEESPHLIYTADELNLLGLFPYELDAHFKLMADLDLSTDAGDPFHIIRSFAGVFDGNGKTISNFTCALPDQERVGLFGHVAGDRACIQNVGLIDPNVIGGACVGSLIGYAENVTVENCYVRGGSIRASTSVGGLVGKNEGTLICCYSASAVSGDAETGGLVGSNTGTIRHCYAISSVSGDMGIGGLAGTNTVFCERIDYGALGYESVCHTGHIWHCYSAGPVAGNTRTGGLVGDNRSVVVGSFWDTDTSHQRAGFGGTGKDTPQMQTANTFLDAGWDFVGETANGSEDIWWIREGQDYPRLWWEAAAE